MKTVAITLYILGVADFLLLSKYVGMQMFAPSTVFKALSWPARTAWLVVDAILPKDK